MTDGWTYGRGESGECVAMWGELRGVLFVKRVGGVCLDDVLVAQWIRHPPTKREIAGSSPVEDSFACLGCVLRFS